MPTVKISEIHSVNGIKPAINYAEGINQFGKTNSKDKAHATIKDDLKRHGINASHLKNRAILMDGNVSPKSASHDMVRTLHLFNDGGKNKAFRIIQSFDPKKLKYFKGKDVINAHKAGLKLANQLSNQGKYLYLVCTHIDGGSPGGERPVHNHIIFLGTSLNGKQFRPRHLWTHVARTSDKIAKQMHLGILPDKKIVHPETRSPERHDVNEVKMTKRTHHISKKEYVRQQVDHAMMDKHVTSIKELADHLRPANISLKLYSKETGHELKHLTFIDKMHPSKSGKPFKVRDNTLGSDYLKETIKHGLEQKATATAHQKQADKHSEMAIKSSQKFSYLAIRNREKLISLPTESEPTNTTFTRPNQSAQSSSYKSKEPSVRPVKTISQANQSFKNISLRTRIIHTKQFIAEQVYQYSKYLRRQIQKRIQIDQKHHQSYAHHIKIQQSESAAFNSVSSVVQNYQNYNFHYYDSRYQPTKNDLKWANISVNPLIHQKDLNLELNQLSSNNIRKSAIDVGKTFETYSFNNHEGIQEFRVISDGLHFTNRDKNTFKHIYNTAAQELSNFSNQIKQTRAYNYFHKIFNGIKKYWHQNKLDVKSELIYGDLPREDSYEDLPNPPKLHKLINATKPINHTQNLKSEPDVPSILHPIQRQRIINKSHKIMAYNIKARQYNSNHHQENVYYQSIFNNSSLIENNVNKNFNKAQNIFNPIKNKITSLINAAKHRISLINKLRRDFINAVNQKASNAITTFTLAHTSIGQSAKAFASNNSNWSDYYQKRRHLAHNNGTESVVNQFLFRNESYFYSNSVSASQSASQSESYQSHNFNQSLSKSASESAYISNLIWNRRINQKRNTYDKKHHLGKYAQHHHDPGITPSDI